ncbi:MAG: hypothetical protein ACHP7N_06295 [Caulobacterales bacterium]
MKNTMGCVAAAVTLAMLGAAEASAKPPALTGEAAISADTRCLLMGFVLSQDTDPKTKSFGQAASLYYWGRLEGRGALDGVQSRIVQHAADWASPDALGESAQTCGAEMKAAGEAMKSVGDSLNAMKG